MAIVVYKCNVCNREKNYIRNINGLERINKCTITNGCRGSLYQLKVLQDFIRAATPDKVLGLNEWNQRAVLFEHRQVVSRNSWLVQHNLGTFPAVSVFVNIPIEGDPDNVEEIEPDKISIVDENNLIIYFNTLRSGLAQLVARQSKETTATTPLLAANDDTSLVKISINGNITLAASISKYGSDDNITMTGVYSTTQNTIIEHTYNVTPLSDVVDADSAWNDIDDVYVRGKVFKLRIINGIFNSIIDNTISNGSTLVFSELFIGTANTPINKNEVLVLLSNDPNDTVDKITDKYVDIAFIDIESSILYNSGEYYVDSSALKSVYPLIQEAV